MVLTSCCIIRAYPSAGGGGHHPLNCSRPTYAKLVEVLEADKSSLKAPQRTLKAVMANEIKRLYEFGPFRLDPEERRLVRDGEPVPLTPKAFDTLLVLVENSGHVLAKDALMAQIWPDSFVEENNLLQNVSTLRKALAEGDDRQYIETVPRRGYRFVATVRELLDERSDLIVRERVTSRVLIEEIERRPTSRDRVGEGTRWRPRSRKRVGGFTVARRSAHGPLDHGGNGSRGLAGALARPAAARISSGRYALVAALYLPTDRAEQGRPDAPAADDCDHALPQHQGMPTSTFVGFAATRDHKLGYVGASRPALVLRRQ